MNSFIRTDTCLKTRRMRLSYTIFFFIATAQIFSCSARPNIDNANSNNIHVRYASLHDKNSDKLVHQRSKRDNGVIKTQNELPSETTTHSDDISDMEAPIEEDDTDPNFDMYNEAHTLQTITEYGKEVDNSQYDADDEEDDKTTTTYTEAKFDTTTSESPPVESHLGPDSEISETIPEAVITSTSQAPSTTFTPSPSPTNSTNANVTPITSTTSSNTENFHGLEPKSASSILKAVYSFVILIPVSLFLL